MASLLLTPTHVTYDFLTEKYTIDRFDSTDGHFWLERILRGSQTWTFYHDDFVFGSLELTREEDQVELLRKVQDAVNGCGHFPEVRAFVFEALRYMPPGITNRRVVCSAIKNPAGDLVLGARHYDHMMLATIDKLPNGRTFKAVGEGCEGFVDQFGNYLTRQQAWAIAKKADQIKRPTASSCGWRLYSECLY